MNLDSSADARSETRREWLHRHLHRNRAMAATTKIAVTLVGTFVVVAGVVMIVTPGPGLVAIIAGLAILASEWAWADRWLVGARRKLEQTRTAAADMDPVVRRKRITLAAGTSAIAAALVSIYLAVRDWPGWAVSVWDRAQSMIGLLPELPGM